MIRETLRTALSDVIAGATSLPKEEIFRLLEKPKNREHGDLAFPCFALAKNWKVAPPQAAARLEKEISLPSGIASVQTLGPFLNFRFDRSEFSRAVIESSLGTPKLGARQQSSGKVLLEYSSPNIAKPFHVGHLRATLIGNALDRVYRHLGHNVESINHLGDWGTQFGFVWAGCKLWGKPTEPTVAALVDLYRRATALKEAQEKNTVAAEDSGQPEVNAIAREYFIDLEEAKPYAVEFWQWCLDVSLKYFRETYQRLNVHFDHYTGESFYSDMLPAVREKLEKAGLLVESQGALGVDLASRVREDLGFARVFTPDGRSLYLTRDLAAAEYRARTFKFEKLVYIVGAPQTLHFQQLFSILQLLGERYADRLTHVSFGQVLGMKTRGSGEFVELNDLLDEAFERALKAYQAQVSKRPEGLDENQVAEAVGHAAIVFSTLHRSRIKDVHFSWDTALEFQGDTGPYLLYAVARINGIKERAQTAGLSLPKKLKIENTAEESFFHLASALDEFDEALERTITTHEPSELSTYALEVAKLFSKAYNELKVVGEEKSVAEARLALFDCTRRTLATALELLGCRVIERM